MERSLRLPQALRFGVFEVDLQSRELRKNGQYITIQEQPYQVLAALLERPGKTVTRGELRQRIWRKDVFVDFDHSLNTAVKKLREALGDDAENPRFVRTVWRRGYRFIAPVEVVADGRPDEIAAGLGRLRAALGRRPAVTVGAATLVMLAAIVVVLNVGSLRDRLMGQRRVGLIDSVAVMPFENVNGDPEAEYVSDGLTASLINQLAKLPGLQVVGRSTVLHYKGSGVDPRQAGHEMKVAAVVTGRVLRHGDRLVVGVELVDVARGTQLWGERYNRKMSDLLAVPEDIARIVSRTLQLKLASEDRHLQAHRYSANTQAYELYLKSRALMRADEPEKRQMSVEYARLVVQVAPDFALGYATLADAYMASIGFKPAAEVIPRAKEAALKALELDETLPDPHGTLARVKLFHEWDWSGAEREIQRALELAPDRADFHGLYAYYLVTLGHMEDALTEAKRAVELDPFALREVLTMTYINARRYSDAIREAKRTLEYNPHSGVSQSAITYSYWRMGAYDEFFAVIENQREPLGLSAEDIPAGRKIYQSRGSQAFLDWLTEQHQNKFSQGKPLDLFILAVAQAEANHKKQALRRLEEAYEQHNHAVLTLRTWPAWDSLRSDPRFQDLLRRMNFPP